MMHWESLYIREAPNPRSRNNSVTFWVEYNRESEPQIRLRIQLPIGEDYHVPITWKQWEHMDAWLHSQLLDES